jgi:transcriptional regulator with XRE-family HTH domain
MATMSVRVDPAERGARKADQARQEFAREFREARLSAGLSQDHVGRAVGVSGAYVGRIERDLARALSFELAGRLAGVVGLDLRVQLFAGPARLHDEAQVRLLRRFRKRLGSAWEWRLEVPVSEAPDQRAWDAAGTHSITHITFVSDAETRLHDSQQLLRRVALKRRDGGNPRIVLLVNETRDNRQVLEDADESLRAEFPADTRHALAALDDGLDPGADTLVCL